MVKQRSDDTSQYFTLDSVYRAAEKKLGNDRVMCGLGRLREMRKNVLDFPRLMTGIFPLDYSMGGGLPLNVPIQFYGPPDSLKSTSVYIAARTMTRICMRPGCLKPIPMCKCSEPLLQKTFLCQFEGNSLDETWFMTLGYDTDSNLVVALPDYAEQGCELIEAALRSDDCGLVIVDSVGSMIPRAELEGSYEDTFIGNQAKLLTRFIKRVSNIMVGELRRGHFVSLILINQLRSNIGGGLFAPSESTAGGRALRHGVRMSVRFAQIAGTAGVGEKEADGMRNVIKASASLVSQASKQQMLILGGKCEFKIATNEYKNYLSGAVLDYESVVKKGKELGILGKEGPYVFPGMDGKEFRILSDIQESFLKPIDDTALSIRYSVIDLAREMTISSIKKSGSRVLQVAKGVNLIDSEAEEGS